MPARRAGPISRCLSELTDRSDVLHSVERVAGRKADAHPNVVLDDVIEEGVGETAAGVIGNEHDVAERDSYSLNTVRSSRIG